MKSPFLILKKPISFSFLGDRNYIDVSTITDAITEGIDKPQLGDYEDFHLKILRNIQNHGFLSLMENDKSIILKSQFCLTFKFSIKGVPYLAWVEPGPEPIISRKVEIQKEIHDHCEIQGHRIFLRKPFNKNLVYNLMKMGKAIILDTKTGLNPRVGELTLSKPPEEKEFNQISVNLVPLYKRNLFRINFFHHERPFGYVTVRVPN